MSQLTLSTSKKRERYDTLSIVLHWTTAACVIFLFASAHTWQFLERGTPLRKGLQSLHISFGILLAAVLIIRLIWRISAAFNPERKLTPIAMPGAFRALAHLTHGVLYLLLLAQVSLGFLFRWSQGEPFWFFNLLEIPDIFDIDPMLRRTFAMLHNNVAWALIILAGAHAFAALLHHYVLRDGTLRRMLPGLKEKQR
ncbi:cytochrome b [Paramixta manurensis]|uniref:Cytochrome b n=1 Tax=Paramixta manurensis TaxID=2740817 RepID=A0A6M8UEG5_9GAMM|nr:cytochrome b [Erwiniaceae bacterium PD-1]